MELFFPPSANWLEGLVASRTCVYWALVYWSVAIVAFRLADRGRVCQAASQKDDEEEEVEDTGVTRDEVIQMLGVWDERAVWAASGETERCFVNWEQGERNHFIRETKGEIEARVMSNPHYLPRRETSRYIMRQRQLLSSETGIFNSVIVFSFSCNGFLVSRAAIYTVDLSDGTNYVLSNLTVNCVFIVKGAVYSTMDYLKLLRQSF